MFGIFKRYKRLLSRDAAESFNRMAAFLTNFCTNESIKFDRPDDPSADNPPCISLDGEWMSDNYVTIGTTQTITGAKKFTTGINIEHPTDGRHSHLGTGAIFLYHPTPYISFNFNLSTTTTSQIIEVSSGALEIKSPNHARLQEHPADTTLNASNTSGTARQIATVGYGNSHYWRKDNASDGFLYNDSGTLSYIDFGTTSGTIAEGDHTHTTAGITDWATATADFLTSSDLSDYVTSSSLATTLQGYASSSHNHDSRYAGLSHAHGYITSDGKLSNCTSNDCLVVTTTGGVITHSNSGPKASDVAALVTQWISNSRKIGKSSISTSDITDWSTATAGFLTSSSLSGYATSSDLSNALDLVDQLTDTVTDIANAYQTASDVSSAIQTALADYVSTSDLATLLADYVTDTDLGDVVYSVDNVSADANGNVTLNAVKSVDGHSPNANGAVSLGLTASQWVKTDSSGHLTTTSDNVVTIGANQQGLTENVTVVIGAKWDGTQLIFYRKQLNFTNGVLTGTSSKTDLTISTVAYSP